MLEADRNDQRTKRVGEVGSRSQGRQRQSWELVGGLLHDEEGLWGPTAWLGALSQSRNLDLICIRDIMITTQGPPQEGL